MHSISHAFSQTCNNLYNHHICSPLHVTITRKENKEKRLKKNYYPKRIYKFWPKIKCVLYVFSSAGSTLETRSFMQLQIYRNFFFKKKGSWNWIENWDNNCIFIQTPFPKRKKKTNDCTCKYMINKWERDSWCVSPWLRQVAMLIWSTLWFGKIF